ncbi:MAG: radical SAM family heme chaperone HemW, partial [Cyclobacteriaceae bacterium]|nr:radical SAM family heme chaperone HemW [Cyclobacteriaceae bacterium]
MAGVYIHIPFCRQACHYCDFHFSTNQALKADMVEAILLEMALQKDYLAGESIDTIYFGGGTPSLLTAEEIQKLLSTLHQYFNINPDAEITLEANPDDLDFSTLAALRSLGINRLSIGIQTFHRAHLQFLNRVHSEEQAKACVLEARKAGFNNISIDLIYALTNETDAEWQEDIRQALRLQPEHISSYSLTIEPKTVFGKWAKTGKLQLTADDTAARHLEILVEQLEASGYEHYEVSNFAQAGFQSKHNSSYWRGKKYLGIGPSAHSYNEASRQYNVTNNHAYLRAIKNGEVPFEKEILTRADKVNEYILTTLRTSWGCDSDYLKNELDYDLLRDQSVYLQDIIKSEYAQLNNTVLLLTKKGKLLADKIAS